MAWLPFYADATDFQALLQWLNEEETIAFIVPLGEKRWIARSTIEELTAGWERARMDGKLRVNAHPSGRQILWHVPSGPLPTFTADQSSVKMVDPWQGWTDEMSDAGHRQCGSAMPWFGVSHPNVIWLNVRAKGRETPESIGFSSFEWAGNSKAILGRPAHPSTTKWWARLRRWVRKVATRIPRAGDLEGPWPAEIWAFPSALKSIRSGCPRDMNPEI